MSGRVPVEHRFAGPAGEICWFEWGERGESATLLLLHATGFHARCWDSVVAALPADCHVIAPDLRGHGRSFRPDSLSRWDQVGSDIVAMLERLPFRPFHIVGHSMGGFVGAMAAACVPEAVSGMLLVDPVLLPPEWYQERSAAGIADPAEHPISRRRDLWENAEEMIARFSDRAPYARWQTQVLEDYCRFGLLPLPDGGFALACPPRLEASAYQGNAGVDIYPMLGSITCPVTVLRACNGERESAMDFSISPTWPDLASQFRQGRDIHWPEQSHFIPMEVTERLASLIVETMQAEQG
jgi:pimeloyl-ACP methyl ester carboxylesterase